MKPLVPLILERDEESHDLLMKRLRPFVEAGAFDEGMVPIIDILTQSIPDRAPDVMLALVLAIAAPRRGHVCVDLVHTSASDWQSEGTEEHTLPFPSDRAKWRDQVASCPLVRLTTGEPETGEFPFILDGDRLYTKRYQHYQGRLADQILDRVQRSLKPSNSELLRRGLTTLFPAEDAGPDRQQLAAAIACLRPLAVISGGPGTGKTYTVRNVLTLLWAQWWESVGSADTQNLGPRTVLAAPTGKAAARIAESLQQGLPEHCQAAAACLPEGATAAALEAWLNSLKPGTLHRVLGYRPDNPSRFRHHANRPLGAEIVVVDEASMVDFAMMSKLVDAVNPSARLILLGDQQQLASVEAGTVLADLCGPSHPSRVVYSVALQQDLDAVLASPEPDQVAPALGMQDAIVLLNRSRRFSPDSGIGRFATLCNADDFDLSAAIEALTLPSTPDVTTQRHCRPHSLPPEATETAMEHVLTCVRAANRGPERDQPLDAFAQSILNLWQQFQILCAHRRGITGVQGVQQHLVRQLQKQVAGAEGDDPIRGLDLDRHDWIGRPILIRKNDPATRRYNGDVGVVLRSAEGTPQAAFHDGQGGISWLPIARLPHHQTVLAMTIHKSQGSEYSHVMVVLPDQTSPILTRELVYTGVTRARNRMTLISSEEVLRAALSRQVQRISGLRDALWASG